MTSLKLCITNQCTFETEARMVYVLEPIRNNGIRMFQGYLPN